MNEGAGCLLPSRLAHAHASRWAPGPLQHGARKQLQIQTINYGDPAVPHRSCAQGPAAARAVEAARSSLDCTPEAAAATICQDDSQAEKQPTACIH